MRTTINMLRFLLTCGLMLFVIAAVSAEEHFGDEVIDRSGGADALSVSAQLLGRPLAAEHPGLVQERRSDKTLSLQGLGEAAKKLGFAARCVRLHPRSPQLERLPLIVKFKAQDSSTGETRFVVLFGTISGNRVQVIDYPLPPQFVPMPVLAESWDGHGLYLATSEATLPSSDNWPGANSTTRILILPVFALGLSVASALFWWIRERKQRNAQ